MTARTPDFVAHFGAMSTVWRIEAKSDKAKEFARENFPVEDWQGEPEDFVTDWRPARDLCNRLAIEDGFEVAHPLPNGAGYSYMTPEAA